jgi:uncharacterized protein (TIGR03382 family)
VSDAAGGTCDQICTVVVMPGVVKAEGRGGGSGGCAAGSGGMLLPWLGLLALGLQRRRRN